MKLVTAGLSVAVLGCQTDRTSGPASEASTSAELAACGPRCVLANTRGVWSAAKISPDSAVASLFLAEITVRGRPGDAVSVRLDAARNVREAIGTAEHLIVTVDDNPTQLVPLHSLGAPATVYRFVRDGQVTLRYGLERNIRGSVSGSFQLLQEATGHVLTARRPWVREGDDTQLLGPTGDCPITAASGTVCSVSYTVAPFTLGGVGDGTFQSDPGSGPSRTITISFLRAVKQVTATIYDPDYAGNRMVAYDVNGVQLQSVDFVGDNTPNVLTTDTKVLSVDAIGEWT